MYRFEEDFCFSLKKKKKLQKYTKTKDRRRVDRQREKGQFDYYTKKTLQSLNLSLVWFYGYI